MADEINMTQVMEELSKAFDTLCYERHTEGQTKYGEFTFLENDLIRMIAEELADSANYMRYQFIKLMMLNQYLVDHLEEKGITNEVQLDQINIGLAAFKGVKDIGWTRP